MTRFCLWYQKSQKYQLVLMGLRNLRRRDGGGKGEAPPVSSRYQKSQNLIGGTGPIWDQIIALLLRLSQKKRGQYE